jgi:hypothetical protein
MMKNYMITGTFHRGKKSEGDSTRKVDAPFPKEKAVLLIYGGSAPPPPTYHGVSSNLPDVQSTSSA